MNDKKKNKWFKIFSYSEWWGGIHIIGIGFLVTVSFIGLCSLGPAGTNPPIDLHFPDGQEIQDKVEQEDGPVREREIEIEWENENGEKERGILA